MFSRFFRSKASRPSDDERQVAARLVALLQQQVFVGPGDGELVLTGAQDKDAVLLFHWTHAKARDVVAHYLATGVVMTERMSKAAHDLHHCAARTAELLAPPTSTIAEVPPSNQEELAACMKGFLQRITELGNVAQGKNWPSD